jgi:hypothetical protein
MNVSRRISEAHSFALTFVQRAGPLEVPKSGSRLAVNRPILLLVKQALVRRLRELSTAIDQVPVDGRFGFSENRGVRQLFCQNDAQSICNLSTYCSAMYLIDSHDAILHVEIQSFCFSPNAKPSAMVHIGYRKFAPERNIVPKERGSPNSRDCSNPLQTAPACESCGNARGRARVNGRALRRGEHGAA